jgi:hypothetical protein
MGLRACFNQAISYWEGTLQFSDNIYPHTLQVLLNPWSLPGSKHGVSSLGSIAVTLPLLDAVIGALCPQIHHKRVVCLVPRTVGAVPVLKLEKL